MVNKNYRRGYKVELLAAKELQEAGYSVARCAGSKSVNQGKYHFPFDLIAIRQFDAPVTTHFVLTKDKMETYDIPPQQLFIQLKRVKGRYYSFKKDIEQMRKFKAPEYAVKLLWIRLDRMKGRKAQWEKIEI